MKKNFSKEQLAAKAGKAVGNAQTLEVRLSHAKDVARDSHPLESSVKTEEFGGFSKNPFADPEEVEAGASRLELVELAMIDTNPFNARRIYRTERVSELAASIGANGQDTPGMATRRGGRYMLIAGHYRLRALKSISATHMALMVRDGLSDRELYAMSYRENAEREQQSTLDNAMSWRALLDQGVYESETEIAEVTGMSLPNVNKTLAALRLSPAVLDYASEHTQSFALSVLYELALFDELAGVNKSLAMAMGVVEGSVGRKEIQEARAELKNPKKRKTKETSRQHKITTVDGKQIGVLKEWDSGRVAFEVMLDDEGGRVELMTALRARFGIRSDQ